MSTAAFRGAIKELLKRKMADSVIRDVLERLMDELRDELHILFVTSVRHFCCRRQIGVTFSVGHHLPMR